MAIHTGENKVNPKVIEVHGTVDMTTAPNWREKLEHTFSQKPTSVVLDLSGVTYMDSAGVAVLVEGVRWGRKTGIPFSLRSISRSARAVLEVARVEKLFQTLPAGNTPTKP